MDASSLMGGSPGMMSGASQVNGGASGGSTSGGSNMFNPMGSMMGGSSGGSGGGTSGPMNMMNTMTGSSSVTGRTSGSGNITYILYILKNKDKYTEMYKVSTYILNIIVIGR